MSPRASLASNQPSGPVCILPPKKQNKKNRELDDRREEHTELRQPAADRGALWEVFVSEPEKTGDGRAAKGHLLFGDGEDSFSFCNVNRKRLCENPRPGNMR